MSSVIELNNRNTVHEPGTLPLLVDVKNNWVPPQTRTKRNFHVIMIYVGVKQ